MPLTIYNILMELLQVICFWLTKLKLIHPKANKRHKIRHFIVNSQNALAQLNDIENRRNLHKTAYWFHAASLGEYGVIRPIMKQLHESSECYILLTFFSSTGVLALQNKSVEDIYADDVIALPIDTYLNARRFVKHIHPNKVVFAISDIWYNYIHALKKKDIPVYLVSALIRKKSIYFRWYGYMFRHALLSFTRILVQNQESADNLRDLDYTAVDIVGDSLFDNAITTAQKSYHNAVIERFCQYAPEGIFMVGSISDEKDLQLVAQLANVHKDVKFIFVPHEISVDKLRHLCLQIESSSRLYSNCCTDTDFTNIQVLVIDYIGELSRMYRYAKWSYVGGGFTPYLHNILEPAVYGVPVAFGPRTERKSTPDELEKLGIGKKITTFEELDSWFKELRNNDERLAKIQEASQLYFSSKEGSTKTVVKLLQET